MEKLLQDKDLNVLIVSLRHALSCMGCGKSMTKAYHGTCAHMFCKGCFEGVNLAINKCMICSAVCIATADVEVPLLGEFAEAFQRFDHFITSINSNNMYNSNDDNTDKNLQSPSNNNANSTEAAQYDASMTLNQSIDLLAFTQPHNNNNLPKMFSSAQQPNNKRLISEQSQPVKHHSSSLKSSTTNLPSTKKQRFLDEGKEDESLLSPNITTTDNTNINTNLINNTQMTITTTPSEPNIYFDEVSHQKYINSLSLDLGGSLGSTRTPRDNINNVHSHVGSSESQFPITQNSFLGRMITDIDAIKKNIANMLDHAADDSVVGLADDTCRTRSNADRRIENHDMSFASNVDADLSLTTHNSPLANINIPNKREESTYHHTQSSRDLTVEKVNDDVKEEREEDSSLMMSQELVPLSQELMSSKLLQETQVDSTTGEKRPNTEPQIALPLTLPLELGSSLSRASSSIPNAIIQDQGIMEKAYFVTAVCDHEHQVEMMEIALEKGWIYDDLSRDDLQEAGFQPLNILVCTLVDTNSGHGQRLTYRTIPYMKALLMGYLIVDFTWLQESINTGSILNPHNYELTGTVHDKSSRIPIRARFLPRKDKDNGGIQLLEDYTFTVLNEESLVEGKYVRQRWTREDIEILIELCGGKLVQQERKSRNMTTRYFPISLRLKAKSTHHTSSTMLGYNNSVVSVSWLFDCICNLRPPIDMTDYLLPVI